MGLFALNRMYSGLPNTQPGFSAWIRYLLRLIRLPYGLVVGSLCLASWIGAAQDLGNSVDFDTNTPNIYVDYDRTETPSQAEIASTNGLGCWIWDKHTLDKQTIHLWKSFNIPESSPATQAQLRISADNAFRVWMDGQEIGS